MSQKENSIQTISYRRTYANNRLDSRIDEKTVAKGKIKDSFYYSNPNERENITGFFLTINRVVISTRNSIIVYDLNSKKEIENKTISDFSPVITDENSGIFYVPGLLYYAENGFFPDRSKNYYDIPGCPGSYSEMHSLYPFKEFYISCVHLTSTPKFSMSKMLITGNIYKYNANYIWAYEFAGRIPPPSITNSGHMLICEKDKIHTIEIHKGAKIKMLQIDRSPVFCSADPQDNLYFLSLTNFGSTLQKRSLSLELLWEKELEIRAFKQPPIISDNGTIFLVGSIRIEAHNENEMLWQFVRASDEKSPLIATLSGNNKLLVVDESRLLCIDENGKIEWVVQHPTGGVFRTQPFCDDKGNVWVADEQKIFVIE